MKLFISPNNDIIRMTYDNVNISTNEKYIIVPTNIFNANKFALKVGSRHPFEVLNQAEIDIIKEHTKKHMMEHLISQNQTLVNYAVLDALLHILKRLDFQQEALINSKSFKQYKQLMEDSDKPKLSTLKSLGLLQKIKDTDDGRLYGALVDFDVAIAEVKDFKM